MTKERADAYKGYRDPMRSVMQKHGITVWCQIEAKTTRGDFAGLVLPRSETADADHLVLKLVSGYNVGLRHDTIEKLTKTGFREAIYKIPEEEFPVGENKPDVILFGTGGTIASRLDYRTGAVIPAFSPGELYGSVPELADYCNLQTEKLFAEFSENIGAEHYKVLAERIGQAVRDGFAGVVIGHGTDTMHHTAATLSFMVQNLPIPVVMVGSQRSSDRPSSDAARNLIHATQVAASGPIAEVMVCMFGPTSDRYNLLHRGTRVRKMHSSYRSTFRTIGDIPLGIVHEETIETLQADFAPRRTDRSVEILPFFDERVTILYYYPNMDPDILDAIVDAGYRGIIIAGTGLGHVNRKVYPALQRAKDRGVHVFMTLQTLWGFVQMNVYETGREIQELGVIPLANMMPEVAYVKLAWALGRHPDDPEALRNLMTTVVAGEITEREPHDGYLLFQGRTPEIQKFLREILS